MVPLKQQVLELQEKIKMLEENLQQGGERVPEAPAPPVAPQGAAVAPEDTPVIKNVLERVQWAEGQLQQVGALIQTVNDLIKDPAGTIRRLNEQGKANWGALKELSVIYILFLFFSVAEQIKAGTFSWTWLLFFASSIAWILYGGWLKSKVTTEATEVERALQAKWAAREEAMQLEIRAQRKEISDLESELLAIKTEMIVLRSSRD